MAGQASVSTLLLRNVPLFAVLPESQLALLTGLVGRKSFPRGATIISAGDLTDSLYVIISGRVLICRQGRPVDGAIAEIGSGQCFGELALLDDVPRMAQVRAADSCTLAVLFREDFLNLLQTHSMVASKLSLQLARLIGGRLRDEVYRYVV